MREHIFRGKNKADGKWYYGDLFRSAFKTKTYIAYTGLATNSLGESYTQSVLIEVDPETVGEYIELKDKNKKKIFEGDILLSGTTIEDYGDTQVPFEVEWCNGGFCLVSPVDVITPPFYDTVLDYAEIIGNIYDNSDLLMRKTQ